MTPDSARSPRLRVLVLTRNLPPLVGGMERLVWHMVEGLAQWADVSVIGPPGCTHLLPQGVESEEVPITPLPAFFLRLTHAARRRARRFRPHWILAASGLTAPFALTSARLCGANTAVYLHGLDAESDDLVYRMLWKPSFRRFDRIIANSEFTRSLALSLQIDPARISVIHPGVHLPDLSVRETARKYFRARHALGDAPLMLYVGRITARKGLAPFVVHALPAIIAEVPDARLVVVGDEPRLSARRQERQLARIRESLAYSGLTDRVLFVGELPVDDPELSEAYFAADAHVFPVQERPHDNEGFGMVAVEAAAHGLPTVAFSAGGVADAVCNGVSGRLVRPGAWQAFADAVTELLVLPPRSPPVPIQQFAEGLSWRYFNERLGEALAGGS